MKTAIRSAHNRVDDLMERASKALVETRYFECERLALEALHLAHTRRDYADMARILMPLQEARRQKRLAALDAGEIFIIGEDSGEVAEVKLLPGCWLVEPPRVGADGRLLRQRADEAEIPMLIIVREPKTRTGQWPVVMIGPVTVRARLTPPKRLTNRWFIEASEAMGDVAIADVSPELPAATRVDRLMDRLGTLPEHEKLHQALEKACHEAIREVAAEGAAKSARASKPASDPDDD